MEVNLAKLAPEEPGNKKQQTEGVNKEEIPEEQRKTD